jgi:DNA-binding response OmpR family regulator
MVRDLLAGQQAGGTNTDDLRLTAEGCADASVTKPFSPTQLVTAVQSLLRTGRAT